MKLGHSADEIKYDETTGGVARYVLILDGLPTMHILCDAANPQRNIHIAPVGAPSMMQVTNGKFEVTTKLLEGPDGAPLGTETRVDEKSVYTYVIPRLHVLLGRLLRAA